MRDRHYRNQQLDSASLVYTKAPQIIRAFDEGAVIRSRRGRFLPIPTENATTMARAYGSSAHLLMKRETVYGQAATGDYIRMPFNRCNLGSEQGLIDDPVLGQGRDPLAPLQDVINDEGDIIVPVDPRYLGLWLTGLFGDPDTTDNVTAAGIMSSPRAATTCPATRIEVGMPKVPAFFVHAGVKLNSIALEFTRSGPAAATISAIAQGETRFGATQGGTPTSLTFSRISQFHVWTAPALQEL